MSPKVTPRVQTQGDLALLGALMLVRSQTGRQAVQLTVCVSWSLGHRDPAQYDAWFLINSRTQGVFDIRPYDPNSRYPLYPGNSNNSNLNWREEWIEKSLKSPQAVVNYVTDYGQAYIVQLDIGYGKKPSERHWVTLHSSQPRNAAPAGAARIQAAWRGLQGRRRAARATIHRELALLPPRHGFPGGANYRAAANRHASSTTNKKRKHHQS